MGHGETIVSRVEDPRDELSAFVDLAKRGERTRESGTKKKTRRSRCRETDRRKTPRDTESAGQAGRFVPFRWNEKETKGGGEGERRLRVGRDATAKEREVYIRYLIRNLRLP